VRGDSTRTPPPALDQFPWDSTGVAPRLCAASQARNKIFRIASGSGLNKRMSMGRVHAFSFFLHDRRLPRHFHPSAASPCAVLPLSVRPARPAMCFCSSGVRIGQIQAANLRRTHTKSAKRAMVAFNNLKSIFFVRRPAEAFAARNSRHREGR